MPRGGLSFKDFLEQNGTGNYTYNVVDLTKKTFNERVKALIDQIKKTITKLESSGRKIEEFCIGKTFVEKLKKKLFDPTKERTWKVGKGVGSRWRTTYKRDGFDGLVVLGAVSRHMLTDTKSSDERTCNTEDWNHQLYALALESALICHYAFQAFDPRLGNRSLSPGNLQDRLSAGYVIYFAFKYEEEEDDTEAEDDTDAEEIDAAQSARKAKSTNKKADASKENEVEERDSKFNSREKNNK